MNISYQYLRAFALLTVLSLSAISSLLAQNEIVPNPNAVLLRNVWMVQGQPGDRVGEGVGSVGDINNDSIGDFAWYQRSTHQWTVQLGGETIATTPYQLIDSLGTIPPQPVTGNFFGDGIRAVGFSGFFHVDSSGPRRKLFMRYRVFIVHADTIDTKGGLTFAPDQTWQLGLETTHTTALAADMDQDGDDELIIVVPGTQFDQSVDKRAEIWIFEGGSSFQLDSPSVVLKDTEENFTYFNATIGKLNNDPYPDILIAGDYTDGPPDTDGPPGNRPVRMKFWWGNQNVHNLPTQPERTVQFSDPDYPHISFVRPFLPLFDTDGDSVDDAFYVLREMSDNDLDFASAMGWKINLRPQQVEGVANADNFGERQVSNAIVRDGRVIFTTLLPSQQPCDFGGSSFVMQVNYRDGGALGYPAFDLNGDRVFDEVDTNASGRMSDVGIVPTLSVLSDSDRDLAFGSGSSGDVDVMELNTGTTATGRQSWRQLD